MTYPLANAALIWRLTLEHLQLSAISCLLAILTACPLGVLVSRVRWLAPPVLGAAGIFYTIPSVALFAHTLWNPYQPDNEILDAAMSPYYRTML